MSLHEVERYFCQFKFYDIYIFPMWILHLVMHPLDFGLFQTLEMLFIIVYAFEVFQLQLFAHIEFMSIYYHDLNSVVVKGEFKLCMSLWIIFHLEACIWKKMLHPNTQKLNLYPKSYFYISKILIIHIASLK